MNTHPVLDQNLIAAWFVARFGADALNRNSIDGYFDTWCERFANGSWAGHMDSTSRAIFDEVLRQWYSPDYAKSAYHANLA